MSETSPSIWPHCPSSEWCGVDSDRPSTGLVRASPAVEAHPWLGRVRGSGPATSASAVVVRFSGVHRPVHGATTPGWVCARGQQRFPACGPRHGVRCLSCRRGGHRVEALDVGRASRVQADTLRHTGAAQPARRQRPTLSEPALHEVRHRPQNAASDRALIMWLYGLASAEGYLMTFVGKPLMDVKQLST